MIERALRRASLRDVSRFHCPALTTDDLIEAGGGENGNLAAAESSAARYSPASNARGSASKSSQLVVHARRHAPFELKDRVPVPP